MIKEKDELLQVRSDILFHDLFNKEDMDTIEWLVMQLLECSYEDIHGKVSVGNIRLTRTFKKEKTKYLDLIVLYKNEKIIIELNNNFDGIYTRNILYAANVLINNYKIRDDKNLDDDYYKKVVRILLVNLNWYRGKKGEKIVGKKIYEIPYSDLEESGYLLKIVNVNLDYFTNLCYDKVDERDKLFKLLTIKSKEELKKLIKTEKLLKNYSNKIIDLSGNEKYSEALMDEIIEENVAKQTAYLVGYDDGKEEGIKEGILENQKEVVLNMHKDNVNLETISKYTKLTIEEIEEIINNSK